MRTKKPHRGVVSAQPFGLCGRNTKTNRGAIPLFPSDDFPCRSPSLPSDRTTGGPSNQRYEQELWLADFTKFENSANSHISRRETLASQASAIDACDVAGAELLPGGGGGGYSPIFSIHGCGAG